MPPSSRTKTNWFSDSDRQRAAVDSEALVELQDVSLRFLSYQDKQYSIKRAALDLLVRRATPAPVSAFWALRDINHRMGKGERVGVLGSNGAGKSTLLRMLARIYTPTSGRVS